MMEARVEQEGDQMSDEVLRLRGVGVRREASMLLRNIDWTAHEDERWILIGPNGAGKTTLLQVAATTLFPTEGTVDVLGERLGLTAGAIPGPHRDARAGDVAGHAEAHRSAGSEHCHRLVGRHVASPFVSLFAPDLPLRATP